MQEQHQQQAEKQAVMVVVIVEPVEIIQVEITIIGIETTIEAIM